MYAYTDICDQWKLTSREGQRYIINSVNEHSSMLFVYLLRAKNEVHTALTKFLSDVEPVGNNKEVNLSKDVEYTTRVVQKMLSDNRTKHSTTIPYLPHACPYLPHQNDKSKWAFDSILKIPRCLISDSQLDKSLWTYSVTHAPCL